MATAKTKKYLHIYGYSQDKNVSTYIWLQPKQKNIDIYMATAKTKSPAAGNLRLLNRMSLALGC